MTRSSLWTIPALLAAFSITGCQSGGDGFKEATDADVEAANNVAVEEEAHGHTHAAPHGGHLIELGDHQYNLEVVFPDADGNLALYVLGPHAEAEVMVAASDIEFEIDKEDGSEIEIEVTAVGGTDGKSSHFTAPADALGGAKDIEELEAHAHVTIEGTEFVGGLDHDHGDHEGHEDHDEEDHDHEEEEKKAE